VRIHDVTIENFRGIEKQRFSFCEPGTDTPRRLSVLIGPNMSGKTTVLDALHLAYEVASNVTEPKLRQGFNPADPLLRPDPSLPIRIALRFSLQAGELEAFRELLGSLRPGDTVPTSDVYEFHIRWPPPEGQSLATGVFESSWDARGVLEGRRLARAAKAKRLVQEGIFERIGGMLYLHQHRNVTLDTPSTRTGPEDELREKATSGDVLPWLELQSRLDQKWDPATQGQSTWDGVKARFAQLAAPSAIDDMKAFDEGFDLRFRQGDRFYYTAGLSYGQQQILRLVTNLTAFRATRSVILIDEVELHLHPMWQRKLLHFMRKGGGDDNQFIVTTHSESIADYLHPNEVLGLGGVVRLYLHGCSRGLPRRVRGRGTSTWERRIKGWERRPSTWERRTSTWERRTSTWERRTSTWERRIKGWERWTSTWERRTIDTASRRWVGRVGPVAGSVGPVAGRSLPPARGSPPSGWDGRPERWECAPSSWDRAPSVWARGLRSCERAPTGWDRRPNR
jgi:AAA domain, putative AbiEii toxin, Type IV TA system/AAA ATPase domain